MKLGTYIGVCTLFLAAGTFAADSEAFPDFEIPEGFEVMSKSEHEALKREAAKPNASSCGSSAKNGSACICPSPPYGYVFSSSTCVLTCESRQCWWVCEEGIKTTECTPALAGAGCSCGTPEGTCDSTPHTGCGDVICRGKCSYVPAGGGLPVLKKFCVFTND